VPQCLGPLTGLERRIDRIPAKKEVVVSDRIHSQHRFGFGECGAALLRIVGGCGNHAEKNRSHVRHARCARDLERLVQLHERSCAFAARAQQFTAKRECLGLEAPCVDLARQVERAIGMGESGIEVHQGVAELIAAVMRDGFRAAMADPGGGGDGRTCGFECT